MRGRTLIGTGLAAMLALVASACGSGTSGNGVAARSPDVIVSRATQAIDGVHTVRVTGVIPDGSSANPIRLDLQLVNGRGATGSMSENGVSFRLVTIGASSYINGSPAFWRRFAGAAAAGRLNGRWLRAPAGSGKLASLSSLTDVRGLVSALLAGHGPLIRGATSTIAGRRVIALHDGSRHGTLYVATKGPPYPVRIADTGGAGGELDFGAFNARVTLTPPADSVDISSLTR